MTHTTINYVDLYETRAVRHNIGASYGKKGARIYTRQSKSKQEWTNLGRGTLILNKETITFTGNGQSRTIKRDKIIMIENTENPGIEISVSNRQKSMRFLLPGRSSEDGLKLYDAIQNGKTEVQLTPLDKEPDGCYIASYIYGGYNTPEVLVLRDYRDNYLLKTIYGKLFVKLYYKISQSLVKYCDSYFFKNTCKLIVNYFYKNIK